MLCYKDRTFCNDKDCKKFNTCERALTEEVRLYAEVWWKTFNTSYGVPIAIYTDRLECYEGETK